MTFDLLNRLKEEKQIKLKGGLYQHTLISLTYNSNHMEGSRLTEEQTRYIYETNSITAEGEAINIDDIIETVNHFKCVDYIIDNAEAPLGESLIKELHLILKANTSDSRFDWFTVGDYKKRQNSVGVYKTTPPSKVKKEMVLLLESYSQKDSIDLNDIIDFHYRFEKIHPFQDGNGRVGRLIMFKECLKYNIVPFIIDERHKLYYYRGLREYETEKGYLRETCLSAQDNFKKVLKYFSEE